MRCIQERSKSLSWPASNHTSPKRTICNNSDSKLLSYLYKPILLNIELERAKFHLSSNNPLSDTWNSLRALQDVYTAFTKPDPLDYAALDVWLQRLQYDLDGDVRVDAMLVIKIDVVWLEALERAFESISYVPRLRNGSSTSIFPLRIPVAPFCREEYLGTTTGLFEPLSKS